jgi:hypothetical protein
MGQARLTGAVARRTGRPQAQILSLTGAGFLAISPDPVTATATTKTTKRRRP